MKKLLLIILSVMAFAGMSVAQDVYTAGYYTSEGSHKAAVYKNGSKLHESPDSRSESKGVVLFNGDVYWIDNAYTANDTYNYGDIFKNGSRWFNSPTGQGYHINGICAGTNYVFSAGCLTVGGIRRAAFWRGDDTAPFYTLGSSTYPSEAMAICPANTTSGNYVSAIAGIQYTSSSDYEGVVWMSGSQLCSLGISVTPSGIAYYDGYLYVSANCYDASISDRIAKVFKVNISDGSVTEYATLTNGTSVGRVFAVGIDAGDVYAAGWQGTIQKVWKNGQDYYNVNADVLMAVWANSDGVYCAGDSNNQGHVWKDGSVLYNISNCEYTYGMFIHQECADNEVRSLPFDEGFENGNTSWLCWTKRDVDNNNGGSHFRPFWDRRSGYANTGDYCAYHGWGINDQENWLISPRLFLQPGRDVTTLTFESKEDAIGDFTYEGVWISTTNTDANSFTEIWSQTSPSESWSTVEIDLKDYQGQAVYIAFKYTGADGHVWSIDDVSLYESFQPCNDATVPFVESFNSSINWCWYFIDSDMSGGDRCWQYSSSEQCAYHPWGQQNTPQEGWLISRGIELPAGQNYLLTFDEKNSSSGTNMKNSVLVGVNGQEGSFTEVWSETSDFPSSWTQRSIDLTSYAGQTINLAFKYEGTWAHMWYIDNISVEANTPEYTINVVANNAAWGSVTGGGTYQQGENVTITATPNSGYEFKQWTKGGENISTSPVYQFTATEDATYTAVFGEPEVVYYNITTDVNPVGAGTVEGANTYPAGATAYLTATANSGWRFSHWNDGITTNPRTITVTANANYTAYFLQESYMITVEASPAEGGTVTGGGSYHYGDMVTLAATPNQGYVFVSWNDGVTTSSRTVSVTGNASYTAIFSEEGVTTYTIIVKPNDPSLGSTTGGGTYPEGSVITISAVAEHQAHFVNWNDNNTDNPRTITVTRDATYVANFETDQMYTITVESGDIHMGSVAGGGTFAAGTVITISANAFDGYYFIGWNDGNAENPRNITVTQNAAYKALFSQNAVVTYTLAVMCNTSEGTVIGSGTYAAGTAVTIAAIPNSGYEFDKWHDGNTQNPRQVTVNDNLTYVAFFKGTGVDENDMTAYTLYPNPARESIRIKGIEPNSEVQIYNILGMLVRTVNAGPDDEISVVDLAEGLYMVRCGNVTLRFVKTF